MRQRGFTFIELVVAIAIVATLVGVLTPSVQGLRVSRNAAAATATLTEIRAAQEVFHSEDRDGDGVLEFAGSLRELVDAGLLDGDLGDGRRQGYAFETASRGQGSVGYVYLATALNQGQTGVRGFGGDRSGILTTSCPPGEHPSLENGEVVCVRDEPLAVALPIGEASGVAAIDAAVLLTEGPAVDRARTLLTAEFAAEVTSEFDANGDGLLSFAELLQADLLAMARRLAASRSIPGGTAPIGDDDALDTILRRLQTRIRQDLALGAGDETEPPAAPSCGAVGFPGAVLDMASVADVRASLTVLLDLVQGLEPAPGAGQMTSPDPATNLQRKRRLLDSVEAMIALWGSGNTGELRNALADTRKRADGNPNPGDWVARWPSSRNVRKARGKTSADPSDASGEQRSRRGCIGALSVAEAGGNRTHRPGV